MFAVITSNMCEPKRPSANYYTVVIITVVVVVVLHN